MPKWKKDAKEFTVRINYDEKRGIQAYIPKPIIEFLGEPNSLKFSLRNDKVAIVSGD